MLEDEDSEDVDDDGESNEDKFRAISKGIIVIRTTEEEVTPP